MGTILVHLGQDPVLTMGAKWEFCYLPRDVCREEFYYPCRWPSVAASLAPYHPITSRWHSPLDAKTGWEEVRQCVAQGKLAIVAEDNYYLPFRPAYHDVHAAHLIVVYGFDDEAEQAYVLECTPPAFSGAIALADLMAARDSTCGIVGDRDFFFTGAPIANRWLEVEITGDFPMLTRDWVMEVLESNLKDFRLPATPEAMVGIDGAARYLSSVCDRVGNSDGKATLEELYVFGWVMQAVSALHADFLFQASQRLDWIRLAELGRRVDRVAHYWTPLRMTGAHGFAEPEKAARCVSYLSKRFLSELEETVEDLDRLLHG